MSEKTPYSRSKESTSREKNMREKLVPQVLQKIGELVSVDLVNRMHLVKVKPLSGPQLTIWVKCAWKPGSSGNCAVQIDFPGKGKRANSSEDTIRIIKEKTERAHVRGATHLLMIAADNDGQVTLAAFLVSIEKVFEIIKESLLIDEPLTRNGASPSIYITANGKRQSRLVEKVKELTTDILNIDHNFLLFSDAIYDLDSEPIGVIDPQKKYHKSTSYSRDPSVRKYILTKAKGCCEYCGEEVFLLSDGVTRYLETHHIIRLADAGKDTIDNVIALCPNHHREAHYGINSNKLEFELLEVVNKRND